MDDFYGITLRKLCGELRQRRAGVQHSYDILQNKLGRFAQDHLDYIAVLDDLIARAEARLPTTAT